jgi:hypothetical protein
VITLLVTSSSSRKKWLPCFLAKDKIQCVEKSQMGSVGENWHSHSESGWMNHEIFADSLRHLREQVATSDRIFLLCDVHASHRINDIKQLAAELNIELLSRPPGATDRLQPLDGMVFGSLQSEARRVFRRHPFCTLELKRHKQNAVRDMTEA